MKKRQAGPSRSSLWGTDQLALHFTYSLSGFVTLHYRMHQIIYHRQTSTYAPHFSADGRSTGSGVVGDRQGRMRC